LGRGRVCPLFELTVVSCLLRFLGLVMMMTTTMLPPRALAGDDGTTGDRPDSEVSATVEKQVRQHARRTVANHHATNDV
jgi:hypothetical protein